jgi:proline dehydrogenase
MGSYPFLDGCIGVTLESGPSMVPIFSNTEIAFRAKSNAALRRSYWLFKAVEYPWLVRMGSALGRLALQLRLPVQWIIKETLFAQFCGGESIDDCKATVDGLAEYGIGTILDYSVEGLDTEASFDATLQELLRTVEAAGKSAAMPFAVFKMTGIARFALMEKLQQDLLLTDSERAEWQTSLARLDAICSRAHALQVRVFVDAEESWIQAPVDSAVALMMERYNRESPVVYNTLQMYRTDRLSFLSAQVARAKANGYWYGAKIVRGAYMEKERERAKLLSVTSPIYPNKMATDEAYDAAIRLCCENLETVAFCAGTHNEVSCQKLIQWMQLHGIAATDKRLYFAQLLGMSDHISYNLANASHNVAKYVPYGPVRAVFPYLVRRAQENTSIQGQSSRELALIRQEWQRRTRQ